MSVTTGPDYQIKFVHTIPTLTPANRQRRKVISLLISLTMAALFMIAIMAINFIWPATPPVDPAIAAMLKHTRVFGVQCPTAEMTNEEQQQWVSYVAAKGYTAYPAAGAGCVDP